MGGHAKVFKKGGDILNFLLLDPQDIAKNLGTDLAFYKFINFINLAFYKCCLF